MNGVMNSFHFIMFIVELGLLLMVLYFFSRIIAGPLVEMNGIAMKIANQDFGSRVNVTTKDEIGTLGSSINTISTNLEQRIQQINSINDQLQLDFQRQVELQNRHRELSATFSHELKTPLTIMRGCIDGIQTSSNPEDQVEYYGIALRELDRASNLIAQMLEVARMESPYFSLKKEPIDLWLVFYKVYDEMKQTLDQHGMNVTYAAEDESVVFADAELLERVIFNALTNAMKYSPNGSRIAVRITFALGQYTFCIENENSHIPPDELENIWKPFYRSKNVQSDRSSGSGLGLMIVSRILDAHGFTYRICNTAHGVAFSFTCPAQSNGNGA